jgi:hypothetical protein
LGVLAFKLSTASLPKLPKVVVQLVVLQLARRARASHRQGWREALLRPFHHLEVAWP